MDNRKPKFQTFNERIFGAHRVIKWEGRTGLLPLAGRMMAEITLSMHAQEGTACLGTYTGYVVRILSKDNELCKKRFAFDDYLLMDDRIDNRIPGREGTTHPYPAYGSQEGFRLIEHVKDDWYIARPDHNAEAMLAAYIVNWCRLWEHVA